jgi:hypothetical protein
MAGHSRSAFDTFRRVYSAFWLSVYVVTCLVYLVNAIGKRKTLPIMQVNLHVFEYDNKCGLPARFFVSQ